MVKCPDCKKEAEQPSKEWKYRQFVVHAYQCSCGTQFRDYSREGKHSFTLKLQEAKGRQQYTKA